MNTVFSGIYLRVSAKLWEETDSKAFYWLEIKQPWLSALQITTHSLWSHVCFSFKLCSDYCVPPIKKPHEFLSFLDLFVPFAEVTNPIILLFLRQIAELLANTSLFLKKITFLSIKTEKKYYLKWKTVPRHVVMVMQQGRRSHLTFGKVKFSVALIDSGKNKQL